MKISIFKSAALVIVMALTACTTTDVIEPLGNQNNLALGQGEDVIRISLSNTVDTRARIARPMGSSQQANNVNRIAFQFMRSDQTLLEGFRLVGVIDEATGDEILDYSTEDNVLKLPDNAFSNGGEICVKFEGLQKGFYKIIAYGYNYTEGLDENDIFPYTISPKGEDYLMKCEGVMEVQEIFAGCSGLSSLVEVNEHEKFATPPSITLVRQVAGLMAYFENVPVFVNNEKVKTITVSSKADVKGFYLPAILNENTEYNGLLTEDWVTSKWIDYLRFNMENADNYSDEHLASDATYQFEETQEDGFLLAEGMNPIDGLVCNENTLFGSCFLLPFPEYNNFSINTPECATLNICYWNESGNLILSVPLRAGGSDSDDLDNASYQYGIKCNNFYSIGKKSDLGGEPDNNDPLDIDEPTGYEHAKVGISDNWEYSYSLIN